MIFCKRQRGWDLLLVDRFEVLAVERGVEKWFLNRDLLGVMAVEKCWVAWG